MKVKQITPLKDKENKDIWRIDFEEDDKPMWTSFKPSFSVGNTIDDDKLQPSRKGTSWVFKRTIKTEPSKSEPRKSYGRPPEEIASIELQTDKKITAEIYGYHVDKSNPFQENLLKQIFKAVRGLGKNLLVEEAKKVGAIEKDA